MANLRITANDKQKEALKLLQDNVSTEIGYGGGAGGGKSYMGVMWVWMMCQRFPGVRYAFGRSELKRLKQTTLNSFFKFLADYEIPEEQKGKYNEQAGSIKFDNGSEILLLDLAYQPSDPLYTRLGSLELTGAFVDESNEVEEQAITILSTRIGRQYNDKYGITPKLLETFNPDKGHVYRRFYKPHREKELPPYRKFIPALATDNPHVSKTYIRQLEKADEITKQRLLYGNFDYDATDGRLFDYKAILNLFTNQKWNGTRYISCDAARKGKDKAVIYVWDGMEVVDTHVMARCTIVELATKLQDLARKWAVEIENVIVDEDGVGGGIVDMLGCTGFINNSTPVSPFGARKTDFLKRNFANLKTQCYFELARWVNEGKVRVDTFDVDMRNKLSEELDVVVQVDMDKDSKIKIISKEEVKGKLGRSPDYSDALMFRFYFELLKDPEENETYEKKDGPKDLLALWEEAQEENMEDVSVFDKLEN